MPPLRYTGAGQAAQFPAARILFFMQRLSPISLSADFRRRLYFIAFAFTLIAAPGLRAQDETPGPQAPPPEHKVERVVGTSQPEAPPSLPPTQIIAAFSKKEDLYLTERLQYSYTRSIRIQEFGPDGKQTGEYDATYQSVRSADGQLYEKALAAPQSSLQYLQFEPDDAHYFTSIPAFALTTDQLSKYTVQFLGTEKVDEIDCYIFQVKPKTLDRKHPLFDGIAWVDQKYLEVVKTYGKWITDLGPMHPASLPFSMFETYRENVEGKYWFPNYARSDEMFKLKDHEIPIRVTIKWTEYKPFAPIVTTSAPVQAPPAVPAKP
jgi:hypothetical protein